MDRTNNNAQQIDKDWIRDPFQNKNNDGSLKSFGDCIGKKI